MLSYSKSALVGAILETLAYGESHRMSWTSHVNFYLRPIFVLFPTRPSDHPWPEEQRRQGLGQTPPYQPCSLLPNYHGEYLCA